MSIIDKIAESLTTKEKEIIDNINISKSVDDIVQELENNKLIIFSHESNDDQEN